MEQQLDNQQQPQNQGTAPPIDGTAGQVKCQQCGGEMKKTTKTERNMGLQLLGIIVFIVAIILLFMFPIGTIFGVILLLVSLGMGYKRKKIWRCNNCQYFYERA